MAKYRGKKKHRQAHPKIFVWSHTEKAEIDYFQKFKNYLRTPLLMSQKEISWTPQELIEKVIKWKKKEVCDEDGDRVWCIFDVDDFYKKSSNDILSAIAMAKKNNIKIAYANECFELWILLHFEKPTSAIYRGDGMQRKIQTIFKKRNLGTFKKNMDVFLILLPFQAQAIKNAKSLLPVNYENINWAEVLSDKGNPSTSIHLLVEEINSLITSE